MDRIINVTLMLAASNMAFREHNELGEGDYGNIFISN